MAAKKGGIEQVLKQARPKTVTVQVCLRGDLLDAHEQAGIELAAARRVSETENAYSGAPEIARRLQDLEAEIDAAHTPFTFTAVGQKRWTDLYVAAGLTEEMPETDPAYLDWMLSAIAASCTAPEMTVADVDKLFNICNFGQWQILWQGCLNANVEGIRVPFSAAASAVLRGYETKSDSPTPTESPEAS
jgi:hypothetical protein